MITGTYDGALDAVVVILPSGRRLTIAKGESVELLANEAEALAENPEWVLATEEPDPPANDNHPQEDDS